MHGKGCIPFRKIRIKLPHRLLELICGTLHGIRNILFDLPHGDCIHRAIGRAKAAADALSEIDFGIYIQIPFKTWL